MTRCRWASHVISIRYFMIVALFSNQSVFAFPRLFQFLSFLDNLTSRHSSILICCISYIRWWLLSDHHLDPLTTTHKYRMTMVKCFSKMTCFVVTTFRLLQVYRWRRTFLKPTSICSVAPSFKSSLLFSFVCMHRSIPSVYLWALFLRALSLSNLAGVFILIEEIADRVWSTPTYSNDPPYQCYRIRAFCNKVLDSTIGFHSFNRQVYLLLASFLTMRWVKLFSNIISFPWKGFSFCKPSVIFSQILLNSNLIMR